MPCPFTGPKIVCAGPNFFCQNKIDLHIGPVTNLIIFCARKQDDDLCLVNSVLVPAQNLLE